MKLKLEATCISNSLTVLVAAGLRAEMDEVEVKVNSQFRKVLVNACI